MDLIDYNGFDQLGFDNGSADFHYRFIGEYDAAFWNSSDVASEVGGRQELQEIARENPGGAKVVNVGRIERKGAQAVKSVVYTRCDHVAPVRRIIAHIEAEGGFMRHALRKVRLTHGQLVEVGKQTSVAGGKWQKGRLAGDRHERSPGRKPNAIYGKSPTGLSALSNRPASVSNTVYGYSDQIPCV